MNDLSRNISVLMAREEFVEVTGISTERLQELLALGWLEEQTGSSACLFREADIYRVRKLERICCDFDLPVLGGSIIVDLLERIDKLERALQSMQDKE